MSTFRDAAHYYRTLGLHPIPCMPREKRPLVSWKEYQERQPTAEEIDGWWRLTPDANVGLVLGRGLFAVDIDSAVGRERLLAAGIELPADAPTVTTGKGVHVYLSGSAPDRIGLVPGVDIRGVGYVVAPPSVHPSGAEYRWVTPLTATPPPAPPPLARLLVRPAALPAAAGNDWLTRALVGVGEGGRDATCTRIAGYLLGKGIPQEATELILQGWAERCTPPFPPDAVSKCVASIAKREGAPDGPPSSIAELVKVTMAEITKPEHERRRPASTHLACLDDLLGGGLYPGEYVILGARPSVGKTALALQIGRLLAKQGTGTLFVSCEMTCTALTRRLLAQESQVNAKNLKTGQLVPVEYHLLAAGAERLSNMPIWVTSDVHTTDQLAETLDAYTPGTLGLVIVDYLQLLTTAEYARDKRQSVEAVSKALRRLTVKTELPFIVLSSLSRPPKNVREWAPGLADLRESGELEHDADIVWLMHRLLSSPETTLTVAKNRDGEVNEAGLPLVFNDKVLTFTEAGR